MSTETAERTGDHRRPFLGATDRYGVLRLVNTALAAILLVGCAGVESPIFHAPNPNTSEAVAFRTVTRYCIYGSVSQAQLTGCAKHVTLDDIQNGPKTNAQQFAVGKLNVCRKDAGFACSSDPPGDFLDLGQTQEQIEADYQREVGDLP